MRGRLVLIAATAAAAAPDVAHAGRSFFGWLQGAEVMPERGVELQNWNDETNRMDITPANAMAGAPSVYRSESRWGFGPMVGITDQLELFLPLDIVWGKTVGMPGNTALFDVGVEARYRLVTMDPEDAPPFAPMIRAGVKRLVLARDVMRPEIGMTSTYEAGRVVFGADVLVAGNLTRRDGADQHFEMRGGVGVSVLAGHDVRFGAEMFTQLSLDDYGTSWLVAGPNLSWTHGRFWVSATYGIGLYQIKDAPRMQWGIAF